MSAPATIRPTEEFERRAPSNGRVVAMVLFLSLAVVLIWSSVRDSEAERDAARAANASSFVEAVTTQLGGSWSISMDLPSEFYEGNCVPLECPPKTYRNGRIRAEIAAASAADGKSRFEELVDELTRRGATHSCYDRWTELNTVTGLRGATTTMKGPGDFVWSIHGRSDATSTTVMVETILPKNSTYSPGRFSC